MVGVVPFEAKGSADRTPWQSSHSQLSKGELQQPGPFTSFASRSAEQQLAQQREVVSFALQQVGKLSVNMARAVQEQGKAPRKGVANPTVTNKTIAC